MTNNPTGFKITNPSAGWNSTDFDDIFVRKDCFLEGGLWLWGDGVSGRLGDSDTNIRKSSPVQTVSGGTNWRSVSLGNDHSAAIKTDGTLWIWGLGSFGRLGTNNSISVSSPVQTISGGNDWRSVIVGDQHSAAIKNDGTLWIWGVGGSGRLGTNNTASRSSPVQTISGGNDWKSVNLGVAHSAAIKTDGTLWIWGLGTSGQLGDDTTISKSSPVQTISGGNDWKSVNLGSAHSAAIKTDGTLWLWGNNGSGRLGDNTITARSSPVQTVSGGTNWRSVSLGDQHSAAIKTDGTLWLWGSGTSGRLGGNTITARSSPIQTVSGGTNWRSVSLGNAHSAAIKTDGTLWLWGLGTSGRLGTNNTTARSSPVQTISGGNDWKSVNLGRLHSAAIREDCW